MTVSDIFEVPVAAPSAPEAEKKGKDTHGRVHARIPATQSDGKVAGWAGRIQATVAADFKRSWLWDEQGPTIRNLLDNLRPAADRVPAEHSALRWAWVAYAYTTFVVLVPLLFTCWVLAHPARLLYTAPVAVPLIALWLS